MLDVRGLAAGYGTGRVLKNLDLHVDEGETVAVVGPNGAGKSTLVRAVLAQCRVTSGEIHFDGETIRGKATDHIARRGLVGVPEGGGVFGGLTVAENLRLARCITGEPVAQDEVLSDFPDLKRHYRKSAAGLSGGERQQLAIARALLARPKLLVLDEPSLGLSPQMVDMVFDIVRRLKAQGVTLLLVEQNARRAVGAADRTYVLVGGEVVATGGCSLLRNDSLARSYLDPAAQVAIRRTAEEDS